VVSILYILYFKKITLKFFLYNFFKINNIGIVQYLIYVFIYTRCFEDRLTQFVDFCAVTNISMFIMTHTQYGYYIHGKSPHGNADASMQQMVEALQKEKNNMAGKRGLGQHADHQAFSISVSDKLSKEYNKAMSPILERKGKKISSNAFSSLDFEKRILAYSRLNRFLSNFIDNVNLKL
jgi:meckelin